MWWFSEMPDARNIEQVIVDDPESRRQFKRRHGSLQSSAGACARGRRRRKHRDPGIGQHRQRTRDRRRLRDVAKRERPIWHALHLHSTVPQLEILRIGFELATRDEQDLLAHALGGTHNGVAAQHRAAAGKRAEAVWQEIGVAVPHRHVFVGDTERVCADLREDRLDALTD